MAEYRAPRKIKIFYDDGSKPFVIPWNEDTARIKDIKAKAGIPEDKLLIQKVTRGAKILKDEDTVTISDEGLRLSVQPNVIHGGI